VPVDLARLGRKVSNDLLEPGRCRVVGGEKADGDLGGRLLAGGSVGVFEVHVVAAVDFGQSARDEVVDGARCVLVALLALPVVWRDWRARRAILGVGRGWLAPSARLRA